MPTVLITGAASGIGRAAARQFAAHGWRCELVDRDPTSLAETRRELPGEHGTHCIDLTDASQIRTLADIASPIDAVINNAGMSDASGASLVDHPAEHQAKLMALNLAAPARVVSALSRRFVPGARVVNVASGAGLRAIPFRGGYSASKAGLIAQSAALSRARPDLVVTVLCPGFVRTELVDGLIKAGRIDPRQAVAKTPLGRMAEPVEMAEMMRFLASPDAEPMAGQVLCLCGGSSIYGGSRAFEASDLAVLPLTMPLSLSVTGDPTDAWSRLQQSPLPGEGASYPGVVDASALAVAHGTAEGGIPDAGFCAVQEAARQFVARHPRQASLTLLLPADRLAAGLARGPAHGEAEDWQQAGSAATVRMLVSTLACELAARGLRVNAIEVAPGLDAEKLRPLVHHVASARSQYLTGQTLRTTVR